VKSATSNIGLTIVVIVLLVVAAGCAVGPVDHPAPISERSDPNPQAGGGGGSGM